MQCHGTGDKGNLRATPEALLGEVEAHLSAGVVADETHGVYLLVGRPCGDKDALAAERPRLRRFLIEETVEDVDNSLRLLHTALALQSGGQEPRLRLDDMVAIGA